jgi:hypothetical protein
LAVEDLIMSKPYGKQVIFCAKQNSQLASPEEIQNLDAQIAKLTESAAAATEKLKVDERGVLDSRSVCQTSCITAHKRATISN